MCVCAYVPGLSVVLIDNDDINASGTLLETSPSRGHKKPVPGKDTSILSPKFRFATR